MAFNSIQYIVFLPIVFILYWICPARFRNGLLLASSYVFYASWNFKYLFLIVFSSVVSWTIALIIDRSDIRAKKEKILLFLGVFSNLIVLFFFKYFNFFSEWIADLRNFLNLGQGDATLLNIVLPVGISFYTFQSLSYVIDIYRKKYDAEKNIVNYSLYISFFPQLVAGPIERGSNILPQFKKEHTFNYNQAVEGAKLILWGLLKKICIADILAVYVDNVYNDIGRFAGPSVLLATVFFSFQIYCDFSAYSDIAIGSAKLFGIELMKNFDCPYFALSVHDFWSRWHISLSQWFKDYLYIPLGGNRCSKRRNYFNLFITFLISGLWHGANWTFVLWGSIHGVLQIIEKHFSIQKKQSKTGISILRRILVFVLITFTWLFFRVNSIQDAITAIIRLFKGWSVQGIVDSVAAVGMIHGIILLPSMALLILYDSLQYHRINLFDTLRKTKIRWLVYYALAGFVAAVFLYSGGGFGSASKFIYFQF